MRSIVVVLAVLTPSLALAQPGAAPVETAAVVEPEVVALDARIGRDAASGRAYFTETALTAPAGSVSIAVRMPTAPGAEAQVRYAITDWLEVGVGGIGIMAYELEGVPSVHAKVQLWRNRDTALAIGLSHYAAPSDESITVPTIALSTCVDGPRCGVLISATVNALVFGKHEYYGYDDGGLDPLVAVGGSLVMGSTVQFVGELNATTEGDDLYLLGYGGARFNSRRVAFDAGVAIGATEDEAVPFPFLGMTGRL